MDEDSLPPDFDEDFDVMYDGEVIPKYQHCEDCGGEMHWCSLCGMYTKTCCVDYGTCMCS